MANAKFGEFKPDSAGILEIFNSSGMSGFIQANVDKTLGQANARAIANRASMANTTKHGIIDHDPASFHDLPYGGQVESGKRILIGRIYTNTLEGLSDYKRNHTLQHLS